MQRNSSSSLPTFSLEEFPKIVASIGEEAKKYEY
jgi:hypothetical protein